MSSGAWSILGALALACATGRQGTFATTSELASEPRRAPGVAVDPVAELPAAGDSAGAQRGLVVLNTPRDVEAARAIVRRFFEAIVAGSAQGLDPLVSELAWVQLGPQGGRQRAREFWRSRLDQIDYQALAGEPLYRESELETYRPEDLARLDASRHPPVEVQAGDVVVRARIATARLGRTRYFGDDIVFLLRPRGDNFEIVEMIEDFRLP
jgi:hypothetical protein